MEVRLIGLLFDDPFKADEARAMLYRTGSLKLLKIEQTSTISRPSSNIPDKIKLISTPTRDRKDVRVEESVGALIGAAIPALFAGPSVGGIICVIADHAITNRLVHAIKAGMQPGTSALLLHSRASVEASSHEKDEPADTRSDYSRADFDDLLQKAYAKSRSA